MWPLLDQRLLPAALGCRGVATSQNAKGHVVSWAPAAGVFVEYMCPAAAPPLCLAAAVAPPPAALLARPCQQAEHVPGSSCPSRIVTHKVGHIKDIGEGWVRPAPARLSARLPVWL